MKICKIFSFVVLALGLSSCMNEELHNVETREGSMSLTVDKLAPSPTRAVGTDNFPVNIYNAKGEIFAEYARVSDVPSKIKMPVGMYYAESHTPGEMEKYMSAPYYYGKEDFEIRQALNTSTKVTCKMANGSITVKFGQDEAAFADFCDLFTDWSVTVTDSKSTPLVFSKERDGYTPPTTYVKFEEKTEVLVFNFSGVTKNGASIKTSHNLTKANASEKYDDDKTYFSGGDIITVTLTPIEKTEGDIVEIKLTADIKFVETEENFEMEVEDNTDVFEEWVDPEAPEETGPITLRLPKHMVVDGATDPALGDTYISAENGIKSIVVKISSSSDAMIGSLQQMIEGYPAATFIEGAEIVGNQDVVRLFADLQKTVDVPAEGDPEYIFPIGEFFTLLSVLDGVHTFDMVVTDMLGIVKKGKLVLAVGCELPEIDDKPETNNIVLDLPENMIVSTDTDPTLGNTLIECPDGILRIMVKITSTSEAMMGSLADMAEREENAVDFVNGTDIVANQALVGLFGELQQTLDVPTVGQTSYTFPIGNFFTLLSVMPGEHSFNMLVIDANGKAKSGTLVLTVE